MAVGVLIVAGLAVNASPAQAAVACQVTYAKQWDNGSGFGANLTINNLGDALTSWSLTFAFAGNQQASQGWSGNWTQSGQNVTVTNMPWNGNIGTGGQTSASIRLEVLNLFNIVQWAAPASAAFGNSSFAQITNQANNMRMVQITARFQF